MGGGVVISDDVFYWSNAFTDLCFISLQYQCKVVRNEVFHWWCLSREYDLVNLTIHKLPESLPLVNLCK